MQKWFMEYVQRIGIGGAGVTLFVLALSVSYLVWVVPTNKVVPPVHELITTRVEPDIVRAGDDGFLSLTLKTASIRREMCPVVNIYRTFVRIATGEVVYSIVAPGGRVPAIGKPTEIPVQIRIDAARMPPGEYGYTAFALNNCGEGHVFVATTEVARFVVEAR